MEIVLTIVYIIFTTLGIFLMKSGGNSLALSFKGGFSFKIGFVTFSGFMAYIISFLLWQKLLTTFDLTYIVPITTGVVQLIILLMGILFFKENVSTLGILGALLVIVGIVLIAVGKK